MDCGKVRKEILSFIYGELDRRDAGLVKDHIDACAECFEEWSAQKAVVAALDGWPDVDHRIDAASIISRARAEPRPGSLLLREGKLLNFGVSQTSMFFF